MCRTRRAAGGWRSGVAAPFHHQRRSHTGRHVAPAGLDRGIKHLAVAADSDGHVLRIEDSVRALNRAQAQLRTANQALARTKPGSVGRAKVKARLTRIPARIAWIRQHQHHQLSHWAATCLTSLTVEDLNVAGRPRLRSLARHVSDAGMGALGRQLGYKARWSGLVLVQADRWFASSKTCWDVNAAINLARWTHPQQSPPAPPVRAA